jgi:hypothetical protein
MGLNPYFNESHSNLDYHEVQARIDNNSNVYERCTAHWYALANARSIGKPNTYAAQAEIFKTSRPGQLYLPSYVDPLAHKWTNTHYTNQAIVGSDNVEGTVLNYENWHQGVGLNSIADERYIASMRGVQQSARIQNLNALQLGERVPDMRRVQNVRTGAAIISTVQKLRRELEDPNYLPEDGQKPTPQQEENIETFNNTVGMVAQAYAGFSYGDIRDAEAVQSEVNNFLKINQRSKKNLRSVGSSLNSLLQIVKSRPIGALPLNPALRPIDDGSTFSKTGNVQAPGPNVSDAAAPVETAAAPAPAAPVETAAAPAPAAPVDAAAAPAPAAPVDAAAPSAAPSEEPTTATPPLPPSPVAAKPERQRGDILHLSPDEIQHLPVTEFDATINELRAMDASQFESFCIRYDQLKSENTLPRKFLVDNYYKPFFLLRAKRKNERDRNYFFPGADYYGETWMGRADEPIVKRSEQRHRLNGGMPPRRKSQLQLTVHPAPAQDVPGAPGTDVPAPGPAPTPAPTRQPATTDANVQAIADAVSRAHVEMSKASIAAFAEATRATIEERLKRASRQPRITAEQRPQPSSVLSGVASALKTVAKGSAAVGAVGLGALALSGLGQAGTIAAAGANPLGGPNANDYSITEGIMTPLAGLAERALGPTGATIVTATGSILGPWVNAAARQRMGLYTLNQVAQFATGDKRAANAGGLGAIYLAVQNFFTNRLKWDAEANRSRTEQQVIDEAKGEALNEQLPAIKNAVKKMEVNDVRKRYGLPALVDTATQLTPPGAPANLIPQPEGPSVPIPTSEPIQILKKAVDLAKEFMTHRVPDSGPEAEPVSSGTQRPMPNPRPMPRVPTGGSGMRYERGDFTDAERLAQKRIKMSAEELADELQSDEEAMDGEGGVQDSTIDVLSSMKGGMLSHRIPEGAGGVLPDLTRSKADLPPQAIDVMAEVYVNFVYQALDYETMGHPYDPVQLANSEWNNWVNEQVSSSNPDRLVVGVQDAAHPNVPPKNVLNTPETLDFPVEGSLEGGMHIWERNKLAFQAYQAKKVAEEAMQAAKRAEEASIAAAIQAAKSNEEVSLAGTRNTVPRTAKEKALAASIAAAIAANPPSAFPNPVSALHGGQPLEGIHPLEGGALYRGPLEGGSSLHGGGQLFAADAEVGKKYTFKQRPGPYRIGTQTFVAEVESKAPSPHGSEIRLQVREESGMGRSIDDHDWFIKDDVRQHEKHAAEALGRLHTGIPASAIGNIAEFLGHKDAIGELVRSEAADKGRPGDIPSVLRPRDETGVAPETHKRSLEEAAEPSSKRQKQGGEKPKRKVSEWSQLVAAVYRELKEKDPNVTIAMAAKEASSRRKAKSAT